MTFKIVQPEEMEQVRDLWNYSFEKYDDPFFQWYFHYYCGSENTVVGGFDQQGHLQNMLHVNPYLVKLRDKLWDMPYIVGVATAPEARGQHLFRPLLRYTCQLLQREEVPFVFLMPIQAGIYLPYEFSYCYYRHSYQWSLDQLQLPSIGSELLVQRKHLQQATELPLLYAELTADWNGVPLRDQEQWSKLLTVHQAEQVHCALVYEEGKPSGYLLYKLAEGVLTIIELLAADFPSRNRLLLFAASHRSEAKEIHWLAEPWDKTYLHLPRQEQSGSLQPFMMARCLNAAQALVAHTPPEPMLASVVLELTDSLLEENNWYCHCQVVMDHVELQPTKLPPDICMDMAAFTQMYFGAYTATELAEAGRITVHNTAQLAVLDKLFPKCRNYINEYF